MTTADTTSTKRLSKSDIKKMKSKTNWARLVSEERTMKKEQDKSTKR